MPHITELLELVRRAQRGDQYALATLFRRYYGLVRHVVRLRMGPALGRLGDVAPEVVIDALKSFDHFEVSEVASFVDWVAKGAERRIIDRADRVSDLKRGHRRMDPLRPSERSLSSAINEVVFGRVLGFMVHQDDELWRMEVAMSQLPPDVREVVILRWGCFMSWPQIAAATGEFSADAARARHAPTLSRLLELAQAGW